MKKFKMLFAVTGLFAGAHMLGAGGLWAQEQTPKAQPSAGEKPAIKAAQPRFELSESEDFFAQPYPSNARRLPSGAPDLQHYPNPGGHGFVREAIALVSQELRGFGPYSVVSFAFDSPLAQGLEQLKNPMLCASPDASIRLVNLDPRAPDYLQAQPCYVRIAHSADSVRPANLLQIRPVPGLGLRPGGTYAAVVLRRQQSKTTIHTTADFQALLKGKIPDSVQDPKTLRSARRWRNSLAPLRLALPALGLKAQDIAVASVFSISDPTETLRAQVEQVMQDPKVEPIRWVDSVEEKEFLLWRGRLRLPMYQQDSPPYLFGGGLLRSQNGVLQQNVWVDVPLVVTLPKTPRPVSGYPLYLYFHGTGGRSDQAARRGQVRVHGGPVVPGTELASLAAQAGFATACISGPFSPERIGLSALDGYAAYNFFHPATMVANFSQMVLEKVHFLRALQSAKADDVSNAAKTKTPLFDARKLVMGGQSLGSYLTSMVAASTGQAQGLILTGAGGSWVEFAFGPKDPVDLEAMLQKIMLPKGETLDRFHPYIDLFELAVGSVDNTLFAPQLLRKPGPGFDPPHILVIEGYKDLQVSTGLQRALVLGLGVELLGDDVGEGPGARLDTVLPWAGIKQSPGPLQNNFQLANGDVRTAVVTRYAEDGILEGHYVAFQRAHARQQVVEFLQAIAKGEAPLVQTH